MSRALLLLAIVASPARSQSQTPMNPRRFEALLNSTAAPNEVAEAARAWFGADALKQGPNPKIDGLVVAWAIEAVATGPVSVVSKDGSYRKRLTRVGDTNIYAGVDKFPGGTAFLWAYQTSDRRFTGIRDRTGRTQPFGQLEVYPESIDSLPAPGVPKGVLTKKSPWKSKVFAGTTRDWWVYVPSQHTPENPANVMIFQDGGGYKDFVPTVLDNLIAKREMPVTVGIFINPGTFDGGRSNRSFEYDTLSDQYARFLLEEILPEVEQTVKLRRDAAGRAIAGSSSGGICAFTAAWERPKEFGKVLSWVGSFTNIAHGKTTREGGHNYEALIRKTPPKPIRVFLQDGSNDLDNANGNWPLANQQMAKALEFANYDFKFVYGQGFHSNKHGRAILPDSLRWLWRDVR